MPEGKPVAKPPSLGMFPLGYKEAVYQWVRLVILLAILPSTYLAGGDKTLT